MKTKQRKPRSTNPVIYVFCEGETEEQYIKILKAHFRVTVKIISKVVGTKIAPRLINAYLEEYGYSSQDRVYFIYDGDRDDVVKKLKDISQGDKIISNPCIELWFLLHFTSYQKESKSEEVVKVLNKCCTEYTKGVIGESLKRILKEKWPIATERAQKLPESTNPSTNFYKFISHLQNTTI